MALEAGRQVPEQLDREVAGASAPTTSPSTTCRSECSCSSTGRSCASTTDGSRSRDSRWSSRAAHAG